MKRRLFIKLLASVGLVAALPKTATSQVPEVPAMPPIKPGTDHITFPFQTVDFIQSSDTRMIYSFEYPRLDGKAVSVPYYWNPSHPDPRKRLVRAFDYEQLQRNQPERLKQVE